MAPRRVDRLGPPEISAGPASDRRSSVGEDQPIAPGSRQQMRRVILEGLVKRYAGVAAVEGASFELRPGAMTYVLGPSGAGKTTLARLVAGLDQLDDGEIFF